MFTNYPTPAPVVMERAEQRILLQFRRSPVLMAILEVATSQLQELRQAIADVQNMRQPAVATNEQLTAIGRIVGQGRQISSILTIDWFTPDDDDLTVDDAPLWVGGAPIGGSSTMSDPSMRIMIEAKVARNFCQSASIPEIQAVIKKAFATDVSFELVGPMQVKVLVPAGTLPYIQDNITRFFSTDVVEDQTYPPYPATLEITAIEEI